MQAGVPIVPIVFENALDVLPRGAFVLRPANVARWCCRRSIPRAGRARASTPRSRRSASSSSTCWATEGGTRWRRCVCVCSGRARGARRSRRWPATTCRRCCGRAGPRPPTRSNRAHTNERYLPGLVLPRALRATASLEEAVRDADVVVVGVPSHGQRHVLEEVAKHIRPWVPVISLSKGLEQGTHLRMTEVIREVLPDHPRGRAHRAEPRARDHGRLRRGERDRDGRRDHRARSCRASSTPGCSASTPTATWSAASSAARSRT